MKKYKEVWIKGKCVIEDENVKVHYLDGQSKENKIDVHEIIIKTLKTYNLIKVKKMNCHSNLANDIINNLISAGFLK